MDRERRRRKRRNETSCLIVGLAALALLAVIVIVVIATLNRGFLQPAPVETPLPAAETATPTPPPGTPALDILRVNPGQSVTVQAQNFPASASLAVRIGPAEEEGINGVLVGAAATGPEGGFTATFGLPTEFASLEQLIIRLDGPEDYFAWAQFLNQ